MENNIVTALLRKISNHMCGYVRLCFAASFLFYAHAVVAQTVAGLDQTLELQSVEHQSDNVYKLEYRYTVSYDAPQNQFLFYPANELTFGDQYIDPSNGQYPAPFPENGIGGSVNSAYVTGVNTVINPYIYDEDGNNGLISGACANSINELRNYEGDYGAFFVDPGAMQLRTAGNVGITGQGNTAAQLEGVYFWLNSGNYHGARGCRNGDEVNDDGTTPGVEFQTRSRIFAADAAGPYMRGGSEAYVDLTVYYKHPYSEIPVPEGRSCNMSGWGYNSGYTSPSNMPPSYYPNEALEEHIFCQYDMNLSIDAPVLVSGDTYLVRLKGSVLSSANNSDLFPFRNADIELPIDAIFNSSGVSAEYEVGTGSAPEDNVRTWVETVGGGEVSVTNAGYNGISNVSLASVGAVLQAGESLNFDVPVLMHLSAGSNVSFDTPYEVEATFKADNNDVDNNRVLSGNASGAAHQHTELLSFEVSEVITGVEIVKTHSANSPLLLADSSLYPVNTYQVDYTIAVTNIGNVSYSAVSITDNLTMFGQFVEALTSSSVPGQYTVEITDSDGCGTGVINEYTDSAGYGFTGQMGSLQNTFAEYIYFGGVLGVAPADNYCTVDVRVTFVADPADDLDGNGVIHYDNTATVSGQGIDDVSDTDNTVGEANDENTGIDIILANPALSIEKTHSVASPDPLLPAENYPANSYQVEYTITVTNMGNVPVDYDVTDDLTMFGNYVQGAGVTAAMGQGEYTANVFTSGACAGEENPEFTGQIPGQDPSVQAVIENDTLGVDEVCVVTLVVEFVANPDDDVDNNNVIHYDNTAVVVWDGGQDQDTDTTVTDPNPDGDTGIDITLVPGAFVVEKIHRPATVGDVDGDDIVQSLGDVWGQGVPVSLVVYTLSVSNAGPSAIEDVSVVDDLVAAGFGETLGNNNPDPAGLDAPGEFAVQVFLDSSFGNCGLTLTDDYDGGENDAEVLSGSLLPGEECVVQMSVYFVPDGDNATQIGDYLYYLNTVEVEGETLGDPVSASDADDNLYPGGELPDGTTIPMDGNNVPVGVVVELPEASVLLEKTHNADEDIIESSAGVSANGLSYYQVNYTITVTNSGSLDVLNAAVDDDLDAVFGTLAAGNGPNDFTAVGQYMVSTSLPTQSNCNLALNTGYNGFSNIVLLGGAGQTLAVGEACSVSVSVHFVPNPSANDSYLHFVNTAELGGETYQGNVLQASVMDPNDENFPDGTPITEGVVVMLPSSEVLVDKHVLNGPAYIGDGAYAVTYEVVIDLAAGSSPVYDLSAIDVLSGASPSFGTYASGATITNNGNLLAVSGLNEGEYAVTGVSASNVSSPNVEIGNVDFTGDATGLPEGLNLLQTDAQLVGNAALNDISSAGTPITVQYTVVFFPEVGMTQFENVATSCGFYVDNNPASEDNVAIAAADQEVCGADGETIILQPVNGKAEVTKTHVGPVQNGQLWSVDYTLVAENTGGIVLSDVSLYDDLTAVFNDPNIVLSGFGGACYGVPGMVDNSANNILNLSGITLQPGASCDVTFTVTFAALVADDADDVADLSIPGSAPGDGVAHYSNVVEMNAAELATPVTDVDGATVDGDEGFVVPLPNLAIEPEKTLLPFNPDVFDAFEDAVWSTEVDTDGVTTHFTQITMAGDNVAIQAIEVEPGNPAAGVIYYVTNGTKTFYVASYSLAVTNTGTSPIDSLTIYDNLEGASFGTCAPFNGSFGTVPGVVTVPPQGNGYDGCGASGGNIQLFSGLNTTLEPGEGFVLDQPLNVYFTLDSSATCNNKKVKNSAAFAVGTPGGLVLSDTASSVAANVLCPKTPKVDIMKQVTSESEQGVLGAVSLGDNLYQASYSITVFHAEGSGAAVDNITVNDKIGGFTGYVSSQTDLMAGYYTIENIVVQTGNAVVDSNFNGGVPPIPNPYNSLLSGVTPLPLGEEIVITYDVFFMALEGYHLYENVASVCFAAVPASGEAAQEKIEGDCPSSTATIAVQTGVLSPEVSIEKEHTDLLGPDVNGVYSVDYIIFLQNTGNDTTEEMVIVDHLDVLHGYTSGVLEPLLDGGGSPVPLFGTHVANPTSAGEYALGTVDMTSGCSSLTLNPDFDGAQEHALANGELGVGDDCKIIVPISFVPSSEMSENGVVEYVNIAGICDADYVPLCANDKSDLFDDDQFDIALTPSLSVVKTHSPANVSTTFNEGDSTYAVSYNIAITNDGLVDLTNVHFDDDLGVVFNGTFSLTNSENNCGGTYGPGLSDTGSALMSLSGASLVSGASCDVSFDVTFAPVIADDLDDTGANGTSISNDGTATYINSVMVAAEAPGGDVNDSSDDVTAADDDGTDVTLDTGFELPLNASIEVFKAHFGAPTPNNDGTYSITYYITMTNTGDVPLSNVSFADDVSDVFNSLGTISGVGTDCNGAVDSDATSYFLSGADLAVSGAGSTCGVGFTVIFTPVEDDDLDDTGANGTSISNDGTATYINSVTVTAEAPGGDVNDSSDDVTATDDDDENGSGDADNGFELLLIRSLAVVKTHTPADVSTTFNVDDGTYTVSYNIAITNDGLVDLTNVHFDDDLGAVFNGTFSLTNSENNCGGTYGPGLSDTGSALMSLSGASLVSGASCDVSFDVTFAPVIADDLDDTGANGTSISNDGTATYINSVMVAAEAPGGDVNDSSDDVTAADDDGTDVTLDTGFELPLLGEATISKNAIGPVELLDVRNGHEAEYVISVTNTGNIALTNVSLLDNLEAEFGTYDTSLSAPFTYYVNSLSISANITTDNPVLNDSVALANASYDGSTGNDDLLSAGNILGAGDVMEVRYTVHFRTDRARAVDGVLQYTNVVDLNTDQDVIGTDDAVIIPPTPLGTVDPIMNLVKSSQTTSASIGDIVVFTLDAEYPVTALEQTTLNSLVDTLPNGMSYVVDSATMTEYDATGTVTASAMNEPNISANVLTWIPSDTVLNPGDRIVVQFAVTINSAAVMGGVTNIAYPLCDDSVNSSDPTIFQCAATATATIEIRPDSVFDCGEVIGKVFDDVNNNGYHDHGEPGIPGARVVTVRGLNITADQHGRYHVPCAAIPNAARGSNFIMKLDTRTLPVGYSVTTENPRVVRLTRGKMTKLNFGATQGRVIEVKLNDASFQLRSVDLHPESDLYIEQLIRAMEMHQSVVKITLYTEGDSSLATRRLKRFEQVVRSRWRAKGEPYPMTTKTMVVAK